MNNKSNVSVVVGILVVVILVSGCVDNQDNHTEPAQTNGYRIKNCSSLFYRFCPPYGVIIDNLNEIIYKNVTIEWNCPYECGTEESFIVSGIDPFEPGYDGFEPCLSKNPCMEVEYE